MATNTETGTWIDPEDALIFLESGGPETDTNAFLPDELQSLWSHGPCSDGWSDEQEEDFERWTEEILDWLNDGFKALNLVTKAKLQALGCEVWMGDQDDYNLWHNGNNVSFTPISDVQYAEAIVEETFMQPFPEDFRPCPQPPEFCLTNGRYEL